MYAAAVLNVPDQLVDGARPIAELAARTGAHAPSLERLVRTLSGVGVFTERSPGTFALTPLGETLGELVHTIRTGEPAAQHVYGVPFFE